MPDALSPSPQTDASLDSEGPWLKKFFVGVGQAWQKVSWPTKRQLFVQVLITIAVTTFATTLIWGFDTVFRFLIQTFVVGS